MKIKIMPLVVSAAMSSMAIPLAAEACTNSNGQTSLQPTQEQQSQLQQVRRNTLQEVEAILTPEQQQQFQAALGQGQGMGSALTSLNLSSNQQSQLQRVMQSAKAQKQQIINSNRS